MPKSEWAVRRSKNHDINGSNGVFTFRGTRSNDLGGGSISLSNFGHLTPPPIVDRDKRQQKIIKNVR